MRGRPLRPASELAPPTPARAARLSLPQDPIAEARARAFASGSSGGCRRAAARAAAVRKARARLGVSGGAKAMIDDGLCERFPCEAVFGMHNRPSLPAGRYPVRSGPMMAGGAFVDIRVTGKGAHGARSETGVDAALAAAQIAVTLQSIVARNVAPVDTAVLSVTRIHAGDAYNVSPQTATLGGTVRLLSRDVMALVVTAMRRRAERTAAAFGAKAEGDFHALIAPTVNQADEAEFAVRICTELVGEAQVERPPPLVMASEDFSFMLEQVPGCCIYIGNGGSDGAGACEVPNPAYDFNDRALPLGAAFFARAVGTRLAPG